MELPAPDPATRRFGPDPRPCQLERTGIACAAFQAAMWEQSERDYARWIAIIKSRSISPPPMVEAERPEHCGATLVNAPVTVSDGRDGDDAFLPAVAPI